MLSAPLPPEKQAEVDDLKVKPEGNRPGGGRRSTSRYPASTGKTWQSGERQSVGARDPESSVVQVASQSFLGDSDAFLQPVADQRGDGLRVQAGDLFGVDRRAVVNADRVGTG